MARFSVLAVVQLSANNPRYQPMMRNISFAWISTDDDHVFLSVFLHRRLIVGQKRDEHAHFYRGRTHTHTTWAFYSMLRIKHRNSSRRYADLCCVHTAVTKSDWMCAIWPRKLPTSKEVRAEHIENTNHLLITFIQYTYVGVFTLHIPQWQILGQQNKKSARQL